MAMIIDGPIETETWGSHTGPDIGGVAPDNFGMRLHPLDPAIREFYTQSHKPAAGEPYADVLYSCHRKVKPNTGNLALAFDLYVDENAATVAQANEFDTKVAIGHKMCNFSSQFNYATGFWQVSGTPGWKNTGFKFGKFTAGICYRMRWDYKIDLAAQTYSFIRIKAGTAVYNVPAEFQNFPMKASTWADSCSLQVQQDLNKNGGGYSLYMRNIRYIWS